MIISKGMMKKKNISRMMEIKNQEVKWEIHIYICYEIEIINKCNFSVLYIYLILIEYDKYWNRLIIF